MDVCWEGQQQPWRGSMSSVVGTVPDPQTGLSGGQIGGAGGRRAKKASTSHRTLSQ